jgi:hypothetical protein
VVLVKRTLRFVALATLVVSAVAGGGATAAHAAPQATSPGTVQPSELKDALLSADELPVGYSAVPGGGPGLGTFVSGSAECKRMLFIMDAVREGNVDTTAEVNAAFAHQDGKRFIWESLARFWGNQAPRYYEEIRTKRAECTSPFVLEQDNGTRVTFRRPAPGSPNADADFETDAGFVWDVDTSIVKNVVLVLDRVRHANADGTPDGLVAWAAYQKLLKHI